jgi:hypothetical protein
MGLCGPRLTANQHSVLNVLAEAGSNGIATDEWIKQTHERGIGESRKATFFDIRTALKERKLVHEYAGRCMSPTARKAYWLGCQALHFFKADAL